MCATCLEVENSNVVTKPHKYPRKYSRSLKAMEGDTALETYEDLKDVTQGTSPLTSSLPAMTVL